VVLSGLDEFTGKDDKYIVGALMDNFFTSLALVNHYDYVKNTFAPYLNIFSSIIKAQILPATLSMQFSKKCPSFCAVTNVFRN
jgi:hypothetical protein